MTPTLAMIVQREAEIDGFKPEPIYRLSISCGGITALSDRFEKKQDAENILNVLKEQKAAQVTKIDPADKQEKAPQLYSLTALQRDANRFLGFTAQQTLDYTQSLYEKKLVTYPRTDSRFLTEDMESMIHDLAGKMAAKFGYTRKMVVHPKQVIKNSKVSDHHAIIPTVNVADAEFGKLPSGEQKVLSLITARLLSALGDPAVRNEVDVEFTCADTVFRAKAKNAIKALNDEKDNASKPSDSSKPSNPSKPGSGNGNGATGSDKNNGSGSDGKHQATTAGKQNGGNTVNGTSGKATKTGDVTPIIPAAAGVILSMAAIVVVLKKRKR